jgi:hypothetical protein
VPVDRVLVVSRSPIKGVLEIIKGINVFRVQTDGGPVAAIMSEKNKTNYYIINGTGIAQ